MATTTAQSSLMPSSFYMGAAVGGFSVLVVWGGAALLTTKSHSAAGTKSGRSEDHERSTTSSAGGGAAAYETRKAVDEYLQFHFGSASDLLPYSQGPKGALNFTGRLAALCSKYASSRNDALDVGCAVGGASFELAKTFKQVIGIDYSHAFVEAAQDMQQSGSREYEAALEGDIKATYTATVPQGIHRDRVLFMQGDACALPSALPQFDVVLAANLLCRLPDPMMFITQLPALVRPGGVVVLVSPYSWLAAWTPKKKWFGGHEAQDGTPLRSADAVAKLMLGREFELLHQEDMPFLIREHVRKFQWGCSHACVWRRKKQSHTSDQDVTATISI
eukprot:CAMPEP_0119106282 /NCGR_PEP_ID=MMETSP1180-20130426/4020_1 /TAXON_ID=3052 ORGANISM="Chlamydomonas cf sp, Strain CCMP681" /NCGR_SAMPLE_ID=MMETSP1180 /ASSEMBLY_ACC=CAM_ASM_000741 /LENGTH=332 /DNA_ID=CAMNT_0007091583 /DNA_START=16 /DNA_END=1014 /DNA_ORIENTATION=-